MSKFFQLFIFLLKKVKSQKGVSLYLAVVIMAILLAIVLGMSGILLGQLKTMKGIENSVIAFYAADTGIERVLMEWGGDPTILDGVTGTLGNGASYKLEVKDGISDPACNAINYCIRSEGTYNETKRAIEVMY